MDELRDMLQAIENAETAVQKALSDKAKVHEDAIKYLVEKRMYDLLQINIPKIRRRVR